MTLEERLAALEEAATDLIRRLDVALPRFVGVASFHALRAGGGQADYGPDPGPAIEKLRELLDLPAPAATEREFWPEGWCRHCDGSGKVLPTKGIHPFRHLQDPDLYLAGVRDEEEAVRILLKTKVPPDPDAEFLGPALQEDVEKQRPTEEQARTIVRGLKDRPLYLKGHQVFRLRDVWVEEFMKAEATFVYIRRCVWPVYDACPECHGTGGRGLPEMEPWHPDYDHHGPWPKGEVIFRLDDDQTWEQFETMWNRSNKRQS